MDFLQLVNTQYVSIIAGSLGGVVTAWFTQRVLNKRGVFTYSVGHQRVGISTEDVIFGLVTISWNGQDINNLYLSTIEMKNESLNDYENIVVRAYTSDTRLMTEQTQLLDTPNILEWSEKYKNDLHIEPNARATDHQFKIYNTQREYTIPVFNRGQSVKITYLNSANSATAPSIWLAVMQKGVRLKFRGAHNRIYGVPQGQAAFVGILLGLVVLIALICLVSEPWIVAVVAMTYGFIAQLPGAYTIKLIRRLRDAIGG